MIITDLLYEATVKQMSQHPDVPCCESLLVIRELDYVALIVVLSVDPADQ